MSMSIVFLVRLTICCSSLLFLAVPSKADYTCAKPALSKHPEVKLLYLKQDRTYTSYTVSVSDAELVQSFRLEVYFGAEFRGWDIGELSESNYDIKFVNWVEKEEGSLFRSIDVKNGTNEVLFDVELHHVSEKPGVHIYPICSSRHVFRLHKPLAADSGDRGKVGDFRSLGSE